MSWHSDQSLSDAEIRDVQKYADIVVLAVEQTFNTSGIRKKRLAEIILREILQENDLNPHPTVIELTLECSVNLLKLFQLPDPQKAR